MAVDGLAKREIALIRRALQRSRPTEGTLEIRQWRKTVDSFGLLLRLRHPGFDERIFRKLCDKGKSDGADTN